MLITDKQVLQPIDSFSFINPNECDLISSFKVKDLSELLAQLEKYYLSLRNSIGLDNKITFGTEIEFENANFIRVSETLEKVLNINFAHHPHTRWSPKVDISFKRRSDNQYYDGEVISPILTDTNENWNQIKIVCETLKELGATNLNGSAGHIHYGTQILGRDIEHWLNMLKMWILYEKIIFRFSCGEKLVDRKSLNTYAQKISDILYRRLPELSMLRDYKELKGKLFETKQYALNFTMTKFDNLGQYADGNSFEVRCSNGTLNPVVWQNNVNFFAKFFLYSGNSGFDSNLIARKLGEYRSEDSDLSLYKEIYLQEAIELADLIFDNNLDKLYFLKQYLKSFPSQQREEDNIKQFRL